MITNIMLKSIEGVSGLGFRGLGFMVLFQVLGGPIKQGLSRCCDAGKHTGNNLKLSVSRLVAQVYCTIRFATPQA